MAVVTGATRGFGRSLAMTLLEAGYDVIAMGRSEPLLDSLAAEAPDGARLRTLVSDLSDSAGLAEAVPRLLELTDRRAAVLVNNAAVQYFHEVDDFSLDQFQQTLFVNTLVPFALAQALLPEMVAAGRGTIINVASDLAYRPSVHGSAYVASKWGLLGMSQVFQEEVRERGIRVCVLEPGWIATGPNEEGRRAAGHMEPAELAELVKLVLDLPPQLRIDRLTVHPQVQGSWG